MSESEEPMERYIGIDPVILPEDFLKGYLKDARTGLIITVLGAISFLCVFFIWTDTQGWWSREARVTDQTTMTILYIWGAFALFQIIFSVYITLRAFRRARETMRKIEQEGGEA